MKGEKTMSEAYKWVLDAFQRHEIIGNSNFAHLTHIEKAIEKAKAESGNK